MFSADRPVKRFLGLFAMMGVLAGCGGGGTSSTPPLTTTTQSVQPQAAPASPNPASCSSASGCIATEFAGQTIICAASDSTCLHTASTGLRRAAAATITKSITAVVGVPVQALATWYYSNCTTSLGIGSYSIATAPEYGSVSFTTASGAIPGCPAGSPALPAAVADYTWTNKTTTETSDSFVLDYNLNGQVAEVADISVSLGAASPAPSPSPSASPTSCTTLYPSTPASTSSDGPQYGDVIIYRKPSGPDAIQHVGIVTCVQGSHVTMIRSKWGSGAVYDSDPNGTPYGNYWSVWRRGSLAFQCGNGNENCNALNGPDHSIILQRDYYTTNSALHRIYTCNGNSISCIIPGGETQPTKYNGYTANPVPYPETPQNRLAFDCRGFVFGGTDKEPIAGAFLILDQVQLILEENNYVPISVSHAPNPVH